MNVGYLLSNSARKYPERLAIISEEGEWTYKAFDQRTSRLAGAMLNAGLKKGDRVLFFSSIAVTLLKSILPHLRPAWSLRR